jgi:hypothetical protein
MQPALIGREFLTLELCELPFNSFQLGARFFVSLAGRAANGLAVNEDWESANLSFQGPFWGFPRSLKSCFQRSVFFALLFVFSRHGVLRWTGGA